MPAISVILIWKIQMGAHHSQCVDICFPTTHSLLHKQLRRLTIMRQYGPEASRNRLYHPSRRASAGICFREPHRLVMHDRKPKVGEFDMAVFIDENVVLYGATVKSRGPRPQRLTPLMSPCTRMRCQRQCSCHIRTWQTHNVDFRTV